MKVLFSLIVLLAFFALAAAKEYYTYDNQTAFTEVSNRLQWCSERLNVTAQLLATTNGEWEVRIDNDDYENDELVEAFLQCLDPDVQYPLVYLTSLVGTLPEDDDYEHSFEGPDLLPPVPNPAQIGSLEDLNSTETSSYSGVGNKFKRLVLQLYWVYQNKDISGTLRWYGSFARKACRTITGRPVAKSVSMHNQGCCSSSSKFWPHHNCQQGGARTYNIAGGSWQKRNVNIYSLLQLR